MADDIFNGKSLQEAEVLLGELKARCFTLKKPMLQTAESLADHMKVAVHYSRVEMRQSVASGRRAVTNAINMVYEMWKLKTTVADPTTPNILEKYKSSDSRSKLRDALHFKIKCLTKYHLQNVANFHSYVYIKLKYPGRVTTPAAQAVLEKEIDALFPKSRSQSLVDVLNKLPECPADNISEYIGVPGFVCPDNSANAMDVDGRVEHVKKSFLQYLLSKIASAKKSNLSGERVSEHFGVVMDEELNLSEGVDAARLSLEKYVNSLFKAWNLKRRRIISKIDSIAVADPINTRTKASSVLGVQIPKVVRYPQMKSPLANFKDALLDAAYTIFPPTLGECLAKANLATVDDLKNNKTQHKFLRIVCYF